MQKTKAVKKDSLADFITGYNLGKRGKTPRRTKPGPAISHAFLRGNDAGQLAALVAPSNAYRDAGVNPDNYP